MIFNRAQTHLYVANDNSDTVAVIDRVTDRVPEEVDITAPQAVSLDLKGFKGRNPNSFALSPGQRFLFVTNRGTNAIAVVRLWRGED
jgi:YVTN family beta-propeller protein